MKGAHIAIINIPGPVHINPTLSIVSSLVRRGYRVTYVTSARFSSTISNLGAEVLHCPRFEFPYIQTPQSDTTPVDRQHSAELTDLATRTLSLVSTFYEANIPSLILYDTYAFAGLVLAERLGVPAIRVTCHLAHDEANLGHHVVPLALRQSWLNLRTRADSFFHRNGIHRMDVISDREAPTIYFYMRDLQLSQHLGESSIYAARCAAERPYDTARKSLRSDNRRSVLISASTTYDQGPGYYEMCMEAISSLGLRAVLAIGSNNDINSFHALSRHCEVVQHLPQISIMPHVDLIICTGGMTTAMEALYHGLPLIMLTHGHPEVEMYADNIQDHGLGLHLKKTETNVENLATIVTRISADTDVIRNIERARNVVRRSPGGEEAVNWIEEYLDNQ